MGCCCGHSMRNHNSGPDEVACDYPTCGCMASHLGHSEPGYDVEQDDYEEVAEALGFDPATCPEGPRTNLGEGGRR